MGLSRWVVTKRNCLFPMWTSAEIQPAVTVSPANGKGRVERARVNVGEVELGRAQVGSDEDGVPVGEPERAADQVPGRGQVGQAVHGDDVDRGRRPR